MVYRVAADILRRLASWLVDGVDTSTSTPGTILIAQSASQAIQGNNAGDAEPPIFSAHYRLKFKDFKPSEDEAPISNGVIPLGFGWSGLETTSNNVVLLKNQQWVLPTVLSGLTTWGQFVSSCALTGTHRGPLYVVTTASNGNVGKCPAVYCSYGATGGAMRALTPTHSLGGSVAEKVYCVNFDGLNTIQFYFAGQTSYPAESFAFSASFIVS